MNNAIISNLRLPEIANLDRLGIIDMKLLQYDLSGRVPVSAESGFVSVSKKETGE